MRRLAPAVLLLAALALGACATVRPPAAGPLPARDQQSLVELAEALERMDRDLAQSFAAPECDQACRLAGHICTLAERICAIAQRHPDDPGARERCRDARDRCRRAQERVAASCRCG